MKQTEVSRRYREVEIRGAGSVDCVIMMYDLAIADLRKALSSLSAGDIEGRTNALVHSLHVLEQLQGSLQMEDGGEAARQLYHFYSLARAKILEGQLKCRAPLLQEILGAFQRVREMWLEVKRQSQPMLPPEPWAAQAESHAGAWSA
jgi:flagellar protein FliS